jgi:hypothetical protein
MMSGCLGALPERAAPPAWQRSPTSGLAALLACDVILHRHDRRAVAGKPCPANQPPFANHAFQHPMCQVCILRRMDHPGIISLKDVFLRPASSGARRQDGPPPREPPSCIGDRFGPIPGRQRQPARSRLPPWTPPPRGRSSGRHVSAPPLACRRSQAVQAHLAPPNPPRAVCIPQGPAGADVTRPVPRPGVLRTGASLLI